MSKIRRPTLTTPSAESYVSAELSTVGLQTQTNGYLPHAIMVGAASAAGKKRPLGLTLYNISSEMQTPTKPFW